MSPVIDERRLDRLEAWRERTEERLGRLAGAAEALVGAVEGLAARVERAGDALARIEGAVTERRRLARLARWGLGAAIAAAGALGGWWAA